MANTASDTASSSSSSPVETVETTTAAVDCDGGGGALGHPRVYLNIKADEGQIDCPYCGKRFVLKKAAE